MTLTSLTEVGRGTEPLMEDVSASFDKTTEVGSYPLIVFHQRTLGLPRASVVQRTIEFDAEPSELVPETFESLIVVDYSSGGALVAVHGSCSILLRWNTPDEVIATISAETANEAEHWMQVLVTRHPRHCEAGRPELRTWRTNDFGSTVLDTRPLGRSAMVGDLPQLSR